MNIHTQYSAHPTKNKNTQNNMKKDYVTPESATILFATDALMVPEVSMLPIGGGGATHIKKYDFDVEEDEEDELYMQGLNAKNIEI